MAGNAIFTWREVERMGNVVIVIIEMSVQTASVDTTTARAMAEVQREIIGAYPNQAIRLIINTKGLYLDPRIIKAIFHPAFITSLVALSGSFELLILYGWQAVHSVAKALSVVVPEQRVDHLYTAKDEAEALEMARTYESKKS